MRNIGLVESASMHDCINSMVGEQALHHRFVRHRADDAGVGAGRDVQTDHAMTGGAQPRWCIIDSVDLARDVREDSD